MNLQGLLQGEFFFIKIYIEETCIFFEDLLLYIISGLLSILLLRPFQDWIHPPSCYYSLQGTKHYEFRVVSNDKFCKSE
jgi:hypothetical protein